MLVALLERPRRRGLATLTLVDEVLMYAREKAGLVPGLLETSAGNELRFRVNAVLKAGADEPVSKEVRAALDDLLATVTDDLKTE